MTTILSRYFQWGLACIIIFASAMASGQKMNNTLYLMQNVPQSNQLNPAIQPEAKVFVGFPGLSSMYLNISNNGFAYEDLIHKGTGLQEDSLIIDVDGFHDALKSTTFLSHQIEFNVFSLGIKAKKYYFSLDVSAKQDMRFSFDKDFITFFKDGNADFKGQTINGGLGMDANLYREVALGVSKKIDSKWTAGFKAKFLYGVANLNLEKSDVGIATSLSGDQVTLSANQIMNVSLPLDQIERDSAGFIDDINLEGDDFDTEFFQNSKNKGLAIDLGVTYQFNKKIRFYASIIDLGYIKWKTNVHQFTQDATFEYRGPDISQSGNSNDPNYREIEDVMEDLTDSLVDQFEWRDGESTYKTNLPTKLYLGGSYRVSKRLFLGALNRTEIFNGKVHSSLTFSANARLLRNFSTTVSYSAVNSTFDNFGLGVAAKLGPMQLYMVSDYILAPTNLPHAQNFNFRFGINLLFGTRNKIKESNSCSFEEDRDKKKPLYK